MGENAYSDFGSDDSDLEHLRDDQPSPSETPANRAAVGLLPGPRYVTGNPNDPRLVGGTATNVLTPVSQKANAYSDFTSEQYGPTYGGPTGAPRISVGTHTQGQQEIGAGEAAIRSYADTAAMGLLPTLLGLKAAGEAGLTEQQKLTIAPVVPSEAPGLEMLGHGLGRLMSGDPDAHQAFQDATAQAVNAQKAGFEQHPYASLGAAIPGAVSSMPMAGAVKGGATFAARLLAAIKSGALYGGTYGAGSTTSRQVATTGKVSPADVAKGAAIGAGTGAVTGAVAAGVGGVVRAGGKYIATRAGRLINPQGAAEQAAGGALAQDIESGSANAVKNLPGIAAEKSAGAPIIAADFGGEATRDLLRTTANVSAPVREQVNTALTERAQSLPQRAADFVRNLAPFGANAAKAKQVIKQTATAVNTPAYKQAMADATQLTSPLWNQDLDRLVQAPEVQSAIRVAGVQAKNWAVKDGVLPPINPFGFDKGATTMRDPSGPSLQMWDYIKRALDKQMTPTAKSFASAIRDYLDQRVPSYANARGGARFFFKAQDALEYGGNLLRSDLNQARIDLANMSAAERSLVAEGFVSRLASEVGNTPNPLTRSGLISRLVNTPDGQARVALALGGNKSAELEAFLRRNEMLNLTKEAMGNSTTWRQAVQHALALGHGTAGSAGGVIVGAGIEAAHQAISEGELSPSKIMIAAVAGGMLLSGKIIDYNFATRVGNILASDDPAVQQQLFRMARNSREVKQALLGAETFMEQTSARMGGVAGSRGIVPQQ